MTFVLPRRLSVAERRVLEHILAVEVPGARELRAQLDRVRVVGRCDCGCPTIDLEVLGPLPVHDEELRVLGVHVLVAPEGDEPPAEVLVLSESGRLVSLEYVPASDRVPHEWPDPSRLTVLEVRRDTGIVRVS